MQSAVGRRSKEQLCSSIPSHLLSSLKKKRVKFKTSLPLCQGRQWGGAEQEPEQELDEQHLRLFGSSGTQNPRRNCGRGPPRFPLLWASGGAKQVGRQERSASPNVFHRKQSVSPAALIAFQHLGALILNFSALSPEIKIIFFF